MDDVVAAIRYVQAHAVQWNIDVSRIGIAGGSTGACSSLCRALKGGNAPKIRAFFANSPQASIGAECRGFFHADTRADFLSCLAERGRRNLQK